MIKWTQIKEFKDCKHGFKYRDLELYDEWVEGKGLTHFVKLTNGDLMIQAELVKLIPEVEGLIKDTDRFVWDHMVLFKNKDTGAMWLTSQPYGKYEDLKALKEDYSELDVQVYDSTCSWYYPGVTCLVVIDFNVKKQKMKGLTGEELLKKVRAIKKIQDIHWQVVGDVLDPEEVKVIVVTDQETFEAEYSLLGKDEDPLTIHTAAIALLVNKFMEQIGNDLRFSIHDELYQAVNEARKQLK